MLDEPLTSNNCVKLVTELLKYILYQKQQIPFSYDSLCQLHMKPTDRNSSSGSKIKEIAILIGATIVSPKLYIKMEFPPNILNSQEHYECKHASRKILLSLMRSMLECSEFQDALTLPLNPTNTFVLIQKSDTNSMSEFFLPKPQYVPPVKTSNCFVIKLQHNDQIKCNCADVVKVYNEVSESNYNKSTDVEFINNLNVNAHVPYQWYQSREVIKGFKFLR
ncbi:unnamed protein product [Xylocopa violacea]|uniref:MAD2L1-binding protein n=1 Tax=Xylocopa violacea TaxID=135666 RepID=A0ABP1P8N1_XYLVO